MKLSCQEQLLPGASLEEKWTFAVEAGLQGIELRARGDGQFASRLLRAEGGRPGRGGDGHRLPGDRPLHRRLRRRPAPRRRRAAALLSVIAELGGAGVLTPASWGMFSLRLPPFTPPRQADEDRKVLEALIELAEHAAAEGVWLAVEPINRYEDYMINRIDQAVGLGDEVERETGLGSVRVCADLFHMNIEEDDLAAAIGPPGRGSPTSTSTTPTGSSPAPATWTSNVFGALRDVGYDDWLTLRCRLRGDAEEAPPPPGSWPGSSPASSWGTWGDLDHPTLVAALEGALDHQDGGPGLGGATGTGPSCRRQRQPWQRRRPRSRRGRP